VQSGVSYTVALIGDTSTTPGLVLFTDGSSVPTDKSVLRVYNLSSDAGAISVSSAGTTVISSLPFKSASNYLTFNPNQSIFQVTVPGDTNNPHQTLDASFEPNRISSVFALGLTTIVDSIGFKFVTKLTNAVPTGLPTTGFAPQSSYDDGIRASVVYALAGLAGLGLLGGTRLALARHRRDKAPRPLTPTALHSR
jgi:hypothetical protein